MKKFNEFAVKNLTATKTGSAVFKAIEQYIESSTPEELLQLHHYLQDSGNWVKLIQKEVKHQHLNAIAVDVKSKLDPGLLSDTKVEVRNLPKSLKDLINFPFSSIGSLLMTNLRNFRDVEKILEANSEILKPLSIASTHSNKEVNVLLRLRNFSNLANALINGACLEIMACIHPTGQVKFLRWLLPTNADIDSVRNKITVKRIQESNHSGNIHELLDRARSLSELV